MSAHKGEVTGEVEVDATEGNEENRIKFFTDLVDEKMKVSLERFHAQISALTEMMECLIQSNSAQETTTTCCRET